MVRKRTPFVDKSRATSYNLIYRSTEDADSLPERQLVESVKKVGVGRPDASAAPDAAADHPARRYPPGHPLAWLEDDVRDQISEERRQELIENGFPDDGYDYLKHLRLAGHGRASLEPTADTKEQLDLDDSGGPSVFVPAPYVEPPKDDIRMIDARRLTVHTPADTDAAAAQAAGGVTAFSREALRLQAANRTELEELQRLMSQVEGAEDLGDADGAGDLLDDFILSATAAGEAEGKSAAVAARLEPDSASASGDETDSDAEESGSESWTDEEALESAQGDQNGVRRQRAGSIASTYWRPERHDRKDNLSVIDERFEQLALEYDSDEIGELDDEEVGGPASLDQFSGLMDQFIEEHAASVHAHESGLRYHTAADVGSQPAADAQEAAIAVLKAREQIRAAELLEERAPDTDAATCQYLEDDDEPRECWDCESVLSLRSNLDNHPGQIDESGSYRRRGQHRGMPQQIHLSDKSGMPTGYASLQRKAMASSRDGRSHADDQSVVSHASTAPPRPRSESAEEKKQRKQVVKEAKREARAAKKDLKVMYKKESVKQQRVATAPAPSVLHLP